MGFWGSIFGAGLGWWMLGPVGAIMGLVIGHLSEEKSGYLDRGTSKQSQARNGFLVSLLVLVSAVMKADGKIVKAELDFVKRSLVASFGESSASEALLMLRDILKQEINVNEVVHQIRVHLNYSSRLELIHLLYGIAMSDGHFSREEQQMVQQIANGLGISAQDYHSIVATFSDNLDAAYEVLEISKEATDDEVKKAYKKMAVRYHPDKVAHLGTDIQKGAEERFKKLNEAYEKIKKDRGFK